MDDVDFATDEIGCERRKAIVSALRPAIFDGDGLPFDIAIASSSSI